MKIIGIIGGIASGKSTIAQALHNLGAGVICVDDIVHEVLTVPEIIDQMNMRWKRFCFLTRGQESDRPRIAKLVFENPDELTFLETITAPLVKKRMLEKVGLYHPQYTPAVVLDAPLLVEAGWDVYCHYVWFIDVSEHERKRNFLQRKLSNTVDDFLRRESRQAAMDVKRAHATHCIPNPVGKWDDTQKHIEQLFREVTAPEAQSRPVRPYA